MADVRAFGAWVRAHRIARDLTQIALAARVGCAVITLRKIEAGDLRPSRQMAGRLAQALAIPADQHSAFLTAARAGDLPPHDHTGATRETSDTPSNLPSPLATLIGRARAERSGRVDRPA
jgi:transcriptional regulator with XRE-family HTH domain